MATCVLCGKDTGSARDNHEDTYICIAEMKARIAELLAALRPLVVECRKVGAVSITVAGVECDVAMLVKPRDAKAVALAMEGR